MIDKDLFSSEIQPWSQLQRGRSLPSPLTSILGEHADPERLTVVQLKKLRTYAATRLPMCFAAKELDDFVAELFRSPELLTAYFRPTAVRERQAGKATFRTVLPFDCAIAAAQAAARAQLLPHERDLAWVAAFAYPCGIFVAADPSQRPVAEIGRISQADTAVALRHVLLRDAMRSMRGRNHLLAATLAAALDVGQEHECDTEQVVRLVAAVRMGMTAINRIWLGW